tara:strand:- start:22 stop:1053 length:1032 start_codon:yes stop_codon:yes gene_type:complete
MFSTHGGWDVSPTSDPEEMYEDTFTEYSKDPVVLMLTVNEPTTPDVWRQWIPEHRKVLVNSKTWTPEEGDETFELIKGNITDTNWGEYTLVQAHEALLNEAFERYPNASHFVLVSGDTAPVKTYNHFCQFMHENEDKTLMDRYTVQQGDYYSILTMLKEANTRKIDLGWWEHVLEEEIDVPATAQWSAISNSAVKALLSSKPSMTDVARQYQNITESLQISETMVAADETVVQAMLMLQNVMFGGNKFEILFDSMSPVWVKSDVDGAHAQSFMLQQIFMETTRRDNWIFARKIMPLNTYDAQLINKQLGLEIDVSKTPSVVHMVPIRKSSGGSARAAFTDLAL